MKIILATGIYPPDIGGPATYVRALAQALTERGEDVMVLTYGDDAREEQPWPVMTVSKKGGMFARWRRYAAALKEHASNADIVYAFSSVSVGVPLKMARLKHPATVLRLGGDFLWERYTDKGGRRGLRSFYVTYPGTRLIMQRALRSFDAIIYSTNFQQRLSEFLFKKLPLHHVIENALPAMPEPVLHEKHDMLKLLFLGRFVRFKNLRTLVRAIAKLPYVHLTLVGEGPEEEALRAEVIRLGAATRIAFLPSVSATDRTQIFAEHDLLIIPSITEISPNVALEARALGLPVLLTEETGLSAELSLGMTLRPLRSTQDITRALIDIEKNYASIAAASAIPVSGVRSWEAVAEETLSFFAHVRHAHSRSV